MERTVEKREKPVVRFSEIVFCEMGRPALVLPMDHPSPFVSNTKHIVTSPVVAMLQDGSFETLNTRYLRSPKTQ